MRRRRRDPERDEPSGESREDGGGVSEEHPASGKAWRGECDYFFGEPGRDVRRGRDEEYDCWAEPGEENRGGSRGDDLHGAFEQQGGPQGLHVRSHGVGSPRDESGEFATGGTFLCLLSHA